MSPFSLKQAIRLSHEGCPTYTWEKGAFSSPKAEGQGPRQASEGEQAFQSFC